MVNSGRKIAVSRLPGVNEFEAGDVFKISDVSGGQSELVFEGGCSDEAIGKASGRKGGYLSRSFSE